jgi:hypothetical protein
MSYWCLIEFIDWRYSQSCSHVGIFFDPSCELAALLPSHWFTGSPSSSLCEYVSTGVCIQKT